MEPSRDTAGRRARELRALARRLDDTLGPDESPIAFDYGDGWTVRRIETLADQHREGHLMRHCLRSVKTPDPNAWSLRDAENLPHLTFAAYRIESTDHLGDVPIDEPILNALVLLQAGAALFLVDLSRPLKPERRQQLVTFGEQGNPDEWPVFPASPAGRMEVILPNFNFAPAMQPVVDRVVAAYVREHTV